ncbi:MAG: chorismate-binding protein [Aquiluna sp.]|nr:chorismate-binding protein [Aquiluna sp.]MCF8545063.1 chorismate-binding protein [Aquiluna sp.]
MLSFSEVEKLAERYNAIPVVKELFSGTETPLGVYQKLCGNTPNTFLLESAEQGVWGRYSFIGVSSRGQLVANSEECTWLGGAKPLPHEDIVASPIDALEQLQKAWNSAPVDFPLSSGLVGFISWGAVNLLEKLPTQKTSDYQVPLYGFNQFSGLVVMDHQGAKLLIVSVVFLDGEGSLREKYDSALAEIAQIETSLRGPTPAIISEPLWPEPAFSSRTGPREYLEQVERAKEHVRLGDVFQVVIAQRFDQEVRADASEVYRALRASNPSPYMYLTRWEDESGPFDIVGSSPEALVKVSGTRAITHPIAGSRPRGETTEQDNQFAQDLLADAKEQSEHLMLVDLARNDLLKVCKPESLRVTEFMQIHKFSHVMHLVSTVEGELEDGMGPVAAMKATFPAGTLSGAPKPRALEIIHDLEPSYRGLFGGVVGYFDFQGNSDLAIAIRTALIRDGVARIQAGAGIVLDSVPESEFKETQAKASVVLRAVAAANAMKDA